MEMREIIGYTVGGMVVAFCIWSIIQSFKQPVIRDEFERDEHRPWDWSQM